MWRDTAPSGADRPRLAKLDDLLQQLEAAAGRCFNLRLRRHLQRYLEGEHRYNPEPDRADRYPHAVPEICGGEKRSARLPFSPSLDELSGFPVLGHLRIIEDPGHG